MRNGSTWRASALVLAMLALAPASACGLRHVYEDWPPYLYRDKADAVSGLDLELMRAIAHQANCKLVTLPNIPSLRRDLLFREGKVDLIPAASDIAERHTFARFSIAYRNETIRLFTTPAKLASYRGVLGFGPIVRDKLALLAPATGWYGPAYAEVADGLKASGQLRTFGNIEQGVRMFGAGRAELILGDGPGISYVADKLAVRLQPLPFVVHSAPVHLMLSKASTTEADLKRINAAIAELEKRGTLAAIRARYE